MPLDSDILIDSVIDQDPFNGVSKITMIIRNSPASMINGRKDFCVEGQSSSELLHIAPIAAGKGNFSQGVLTLSSSELEGPCKFSILFDDGCIVTKDLTDDLENTFYIWELTEDDCEAFLFKKIHIIRAETKTKRIDYDFENQASYLQGLSEIFPILIERFLKEAAEHISWVPPVCEESPSNSNNLLHRQSSPVFEDSAADYCYVYLMNDTATGYYKIGMSNNPEYRESTLQSEKPTIEKICHKKYPSRRIARGIEATLHRIFDEKRIRGEWFRLNEKDIWEIKQTLS